LPDERERNALWVDVKFSDQSDRFEWRKTKTALIGLQWAAGRHPEDEDDGECALMSVGDSSTLYRLKETLCDDTIALALCCKEYMYTYW